MKVLHRWQTWIGILLLVIAIMPATARAQIPSITGISPQAAKPGATVDLKIRGSDLADATELWTSFRAEVSRIADDTSGDKNASEFTYRVKFPVETSLGIHGIRVVTGHGISNQTLFVIDDLDSVAQEKSNSTPATAQAVILPVAVDGNVEALSHHYWKFQVRQGDAISFEVLARRLGSPLDPTIRLLDAAGNELAYNDDTPGLRSDSRLNYNFAQAGEYLIELTDVRFNGGDDHRFRLRMGDFPCVTSTYPLGVNRGSNTEIGFAGTNLRDVLPVQVDVPTDPVVKWINVAAKALGGSSSGFATLAVGTNEVLEKEPNDQQATATEVSLGATLNGRFATPGDVDHFVFAAKKGQRFVFSGITRRQGSPTALSGRLLQPDGKQVAELVHTGKNDTPIDFTFPADGNFILAVAELHGYGGPEFAYRIKVQPFAVGFDLTASVDTLNIPAGGTSMVLLTATRKDYDGPIEISAENLPAGIVVTPTVIGPGREIVAVTVENTSAATGKVTHIDLVGTATINDTPYRAVADVTTAQSAALNGLAWPPLGLPAGIAVAATDAPSFVLKAEPSTLIFGRDLKATVKVTATRKDYQGEITLSVIPAKGGIPPEVSSNINLRPLARDTNEVEITFSATAKAVLGDFSIVLMGKARDADRDSHKEPPEQAVPGLRLKLRDPYTLRVTGGSITRGGSLTVKVATERNPAYNGPITLTFANMPQGVSAAPATIPAGKNEVEVLLTATKDTSVGKVDNIIVQGHETRDDAKFTGKSPPFMLTVQ